MSQKSAKRLRKLEDRVETLEHNERVPCMIDDGYIKTVQADRDDALLKAVMAEHIADMWRNLALGVALAAVVVEIIAVAVTWVKADDLFTVPTGIPLTVLTTTEVMDGAPVAESEDEPEANENQLIEAALLARAVRLDDVTVTHYDTCTVCCGKDDGITASGLKATPGVSVAVDPTIIPLGSDVLVDYGDGDLQYYRADDTGHGVDGNAIDLCVATHEEAVELGVKTATVYYVAPE